MKYFAQRRAVSLQVIIYSVRNLINIFPSKNNGHYHMKLRSLDFTLSCYFSILIIINMFIDSLTLLKI